MTKMIKFTEENFSRIAKLTPLPIDLLRSIVPNTPESYLLIYNNGTIQLLSPEELLTKLASEKESSVDILSAEVGNLKLELDDPLQEAPKIVYCECGDRITKDDSSDWYHFKNDKYLCSERYAKPRKD